MRQHSSMLDHVLMRPQTDRECGWVFSKQRAERVLVFLAAMRQLPKLHWSDRQSQASCLAENLLVVPKQFRTPQRIDGFPAFFSQVRVCTGRADCGSIQTEEAVFKIAGNVPKIRANAMNKIAVAQERQPSACKASICLRAACKRFTITPLIRFKS